MIEKVKRQGHFLVPGRWGGWLRLEGEEAGEEE
jgi:hypothetical protein